MDHAERYAWAIATLDAMPPRVRQAVIARRRMRERNDTKFVLEKGRRVRSVPRRLQHLSAADPLTQPPTPFDLYIEATYGSTTDGKS